VRVTWVAALAKVRVYHGRMAVVANWGITAA
jgi:hypothetical protein